MNPVIYIFINKSLHMSVGKVASQAAHAAAMAVAPFGLRWKNTKTIIILEARDEHHIQNIRRYLQGHDIYLFEIIDEGMNEIDPQAVTAAYTQVMDRDNEIYRKVMEQFKTYRDPIKINLEFER